jgi:hypothetical protein
MTKSFKQFMSESILTESEIDFILSESGIEGIKTMISNEIGAAVKPLKTQLNTVMTGVEDLVAKVTKVIRAKAFEDLHVGKHQMQAEWNTIKKILNNPEAIVRQLVGRLLNIEYAGKDYPVVITKGTS